MKLKILGPPGTGKTNRLMQYLEKELEQGTLPSKISFLTFTRAARVEALQRTGKTEKDFPYLKTIHAICYRQLAIGKDQIVRPENLRVFGRQIGAKLTGNNLDPWIEEFERGIDAPTRDDLLIQANHCGRHRKIMLREALQGVSTEIDFKYATWFTKAYRSWKDHNGMLDYTDLLTKYIEYGKPLDIDVLFVDEAQDLSSLQWEAVFKLGANAQKWFIAGDDDQAIFHWAGADSDMFQDLVTDQVEVLGQSFRVSKAVHFAASKISSRISKRLTKDYAPTQSEGQVTNAGYLGSVDLDEKTFILFRNHYRGAEISQVLKNESIPFIGRGSPLLNPDTRMTLLAWHQFLKKGYAESSVARCMIRHTSEEYLTGHAMSHAKEKPVVTVADVFTRAPEWHKWYTILQDLPGKDLLGSYIRKYGFLRVAKPKVELLSVHQSKGREAHTVIIDPEMSRATWLSMMSRPDDEHRVWYVAVTRAKERVFYLLPDGNFSYKF